MKKRILAALLALCLVMLCACSGDDTSSTSSAAGESSTATESSEAGETSETGETSDVAETPTELPFGPDNPIELTAAVNQSPIQGDFNEIQILKDYAEESGIHITYQNIPASDVATQLSLMLNSGELPDILMKMNVTSTDQAKITAAAQSAGINLTRYKLTAFVVSAVFAGLAGVLYGLNFSSLTASRFDYNTSIQILVFVVLGGMGSVRGSIIAAALLTVLPEMLRGLNDYRMLIYAVVLIAMMIFNQSPQMVAWRKRFVEKFRARFAKNKEVA